MPVVRTATFSTWANAGAADASSTKGSKMNDRNFMAFRLTAEALAKAVHRYRIEKTTQLPIIKVFNRTLTARTVFTPRARKEGGRRWTIQI